MNRAMNRSNGNGKHLFQPDGGGKAGVIRARVAWNFPADADFDSKNVQIFRRQCFLSQLVQGLCLSNEAAHFRRGRDFSPKQAKAAGTMGSLYWTVNSDYSGLDWGSLDVDGRWRLTHHMIQQVYAPLMLSTVVVGSTLVVHAANDRLSEAHTSQFVLRVIRLSDGATKQLSIPAAEISAQSGMVIFNASVASVLKQGSCASPGDCCAFVSPSKDTDAAPPQINADGSMVIFAHFPELNLTAANVTTKVAAESGNIVNVTLEADAVALYVTLSSSVLGRFSSNGLLLLPHHPQQLQFTAWEEFDIASFHTTVDVQGVNLAGATVEQ